MSFKGSGSVVQDAIIRKEELGKLIDDHIMNIISLSFSTVLDIIDPLFQVQQQYRHETLLESSHQGDIIIISSCFYSEEYNNLN